MDPLKEAIARLCYEQYRREGGEISMEELRRRYFKLLGQEDWPEPRREQPKDPRKEP